MPVAPDLCGIALDGRYELHAMIGEGAFGRVYRGRDRRLARTVAVKVIKPWWGEDPEWVEVFEREAQLLARVSDPGIVQIYDVGHAEEGLYYVSELVEGESLAGRFARGPFEPWEAAALAEQLCRALAQAHAQRIIHRDVKPANILISRRGRVKVGDFGVARLGGGTSDGALGTVVGTPRYMAPEQGRGRATSPATDVYSVGVVLYEMLAGSPPFDGATAVELALRHLQDAPPPLPASTPRPLAKIVARALATAPGDRYADAGAMAGALAAVRAGTRPAPGAADRPSARRPPARPLASGSSRLESTRPAPRRSPRRSWNPAGRRRTAALFVLVLALIGAMLAAALLVGGAVPARVPDLRGLSRAQARARAAGARLRTLAGVRYDLRAGAGTVIAQSPPPGRRVAPNSLVRLLVSRGPAPVMVPDLRTELGADAELTLNRLGLRARLVAGPDYPGRRPGYVYGQSPAGNASAPAGSTITLDVAEIPRWQPVAAFSGTGGTSSVAFTIRGPRWRVLYTMQYRGTCTFIFFCSGPSLRGIADPGGQTIDAFGLKDGTAQTHVFSSGPGSYRLQVAPGRDDAEYRIQVQDLY